MGDFPLFPYLGLKLVAYIIWCYVGLRLMSPPEPDQEGLVESVVSGDSHYPVAPAIGWGLARLILGISLGTVIWFVSTFVYAGLYEVGTERTHREVLTYLYVYVPVRWLEWSLLAILMIRSERGSVATFLVGAAARSRLWRLGGVAISCLADIPMMIEIGGLPIGRFFC